MSRHDTDGNRYPITRIPAGCKHLHGNLFMVPFAAIRTPDPEDDNRRKQYTFRNPRTLTEKGQADLLDRKLSEQLRNSIKTRTLLNPLVCRWSPEGDRHIPMLVGGDRRYRCLEYLIRRKERVLDPRSLCDKGGGVLGYEFDTADKAYELVPCQVFGCRDDLEALALAWAENKNRVNLTDGHEVAEVLKLRYAEASDDRIMDILQQDQRWLARTDRMIASLDPSTLADLLEGRMDRSSAERLAGIDDEDKRDQVREVANRVAERRHSRRRTILDGQLEQARQRQDIAEGAEVTATNDDRRQRAAEQVAVAGAEARAIERRIETDRPVVTTREVLEAEREVGSKRTRKAPTMKAERIRSGQRYLLGIVRNEGRCPDGTFVADVNAIKLVMRVLKGNILDNSEDWAKTLRRHFGS